MVDEIAKQVCIQFYIREFAKAKQNSPRKEALFESFKSAFDLICKLKSNSSKDEDYYTQNGSLRVFLGQFMYCTFGFREAVLCGHFLRMISWLPSQVFTKSINFQSAKSFVVSRKLGRIQLEALRNKLFVLLGQDPLTFFLGLMKGGLSWFSQMVDIRASLVSRLKRVSCDKFAAARHLVHFRVDDWTPPQLVALILFNRVLNLLETYRYTNSFKHDDFARQFKDHFFNEKSAEFRLAPQSPLDYSKRRRASMKRVVFRSDLKWTPSGKVLVTVGLGWVGLPDWHFTHSPPASTLDGLDQEIDCCPYSLQELTVSVDESIMKTHELFLLPFQIKAVDGVYCLWTYAVFLTPPIYLVAGFLEIFGTKKE